MGSQEGVSRKGAKAQRGGRWDFGEGVGFGDLGKVCFLLYRKHKQA